MPDLFVLLFIGFAAVGYKNQNVSNMPNLLIDLTLIPCKPDVMRRKTVALSDTLEMPNNITKEELVVKIRDNNNMNCLCSN